MVIVIIIISIIIIIIITIIFIIIIIFDHHFRLFFNSIPVYLFSIINFSVQSKGRSWFPCRCIWKHRNVR